MKNLWNSAATLIKKLQKTFKLKDFIRSIHPGSYKVIMIKISKYRDDLYVIYINRLSDGDKITIIIN